MMIIDPVTLGDVTCTRASVKWAFDRTGTLVQVPVNTLAVTYDPSDLTKAPYALVEPAATNFVTASETLTTGWAGNPLLTPGTVYFGSLQYQQIAKTTSAASESWSCSGAMAVVFGDTCTLTIALRAGTSSLVTVGVYGGPSATWGENASSTLSIVSGPGVITSQVGSLASLSGLSATADTILQITRGCDFSGSVGVYIYPGSVGSATIGDSILATRVQLERGGKPTSYIPTTTTAVSRSVDVIAAGAGLVYSNVAITETSYSSTATYSKNAIVFDPATYMQYESLIANNVGKALTDTTSWTPLLTSVNRWQMFDQYNNTQTSSTEEIIVVLSPATIAQGFFLGNVDATEVRLSCVSASAGLVYQEVQNLIVASSGSSFYNWFFKRIRRRSYVVSVTLPPYSDAFVTITIKKPGGTAKCGVCVIGPLVDIGLSQYGLSREIKDYSTVNFNFDGTSNVVKRNFAKVMDVDVIVENDQIDYVIQSLESYRQKPMAWIGASAYGSACLFGPYVNFKSVIAYPTESTMNLQIQGTV